MTDLDLTVITATLPERNELLNAANLSVAMQTRYPRGGHVIVTDVLREGPARTLNRAFEDVSTEWVFRLDDDDLLDKDHFEVLGRHLTDDYDIVYSHCRSDDDDPERFRVNLQADFGWDHLYAVNWIPSSAAIRSSLWRDLGGLADVDLEDWDFWKRALTAGARFVCVPAVTWTYRNGGEWAHRNTDAPSALDIDVLRERYGEDVAQEAIEHWSK